MRNENTRINFIFITNYIMLKLKCASCWNIYEVNATVVDKPTVEKKQKKEKKLVAKKSYYQKKKAREYARARYHANRAKKVAKKPTIVALKPAEVDDSFLSFD